MAANKTRSPRKSADLDLDSDLCPAAVRRRIAVIIAAARRRTEADADTGDIRDRFKVLLRTSKPSTVSIT